MNSYPLLPFTPNASLVHSMITRSQPYSTWPTTLFTLLFFSCSQHDYALAALQHLADNPSALDGHGGRGRLLLVEFAVDSILKVKLHAQRSLAGTQKREAEAAGALLYKNIFIYLFINI